MRWPIRNQLLLPTLTVVVLAIVAASGVIAWMGAAQARRHQQETLGRLVLALANATFPRTERVLEQMKGLSGADFVFLDDRKGVQSSTLSFSETELDAVQSLASHDEEARFTPASRVHLNGQDYLTDRVPVSKGRAGMAPGWLIILFPEDRWSTAIRRAAYPALATGAVASVVVVLMTAGLAHRFVGRIGQLSRHAAAIAAGRFEPLAVPRRNDEIRDLVVSINRMARRLGDHAAEIRRSERLHTLAQLGAGLAHQLRNSAAGARMAIELHAEECATGADCESLAVAMRQLRMMESYLQRFLMLGDPRPAPFQAIDLGRLAEGVLDLVRPAASHARVDLCLRRDAEPGEVEGDENALRQLLINLVLNAVEAACRNPARDPRVVVEIGAADDDRVVIDVGDTGAGPAAAIAGRLFEPFATDKPEGTGLGLFVAREVVESHRGAIRHVRRDGLTHFVVELPRKGCRLPNAAQARPPHS